MADEQQSGGPAPAQKGGYGKRPWWQWLLIYVVVGGVLYALIYYLFFAGSGGLY